ncbi:MAG: hypothetical protein K6G07_00055 [Lachnospiraceae bacterium]|nr:hypothetical protein [Lachnospiraceae bacterium]
MAKQATDQARQQLQKVFDKLGKFGGTIQTKKPEEWKTFDLEVERMDKETKDIMIGVFHSVDGEVLFYPQFRLSLKMEEDSIVEAYIHNCIKQTIFGTTEIDSEDLITGFGNVEKTTPGLEQEFTDFMEDIAKKGPYLTKPEKITKYDRTLAEA